MKKIFISGYNLDQLTNIFPQSGFLIWREDRPIPRRYKDRELLYEVDFIIFNISHPSSQFRYLLAKATLFRKPVLFYYPDNPVNLIKLLENKI